MTSESSRHGTTAIRALQRAVDGHAVVARSARKAGPIMVVMQLVMMFILLVMVFIECAPASGCGAKTRRGISCQYLAMQKSSTGNEQGPWKRRANHQPITDPSDHFRCRQPLSPAPEQTFCIAKSLNVYFSSTGIKQGPWRANHQPITDPSDRFRCRQPLSPAPKQTFCIANSLNVAYWPPAMSQTEVRITVLAPHWPAGAPRSRGSSLQYGTWSSQPGMQQCRILQKRTIP